MRCRSSFRSQNKEAKSLTSWPHALYSKRSEQRPYVTAMSPCLNLIGWEKTNCIDSGCAALEASHSCLA